MTRSIVLETETVEKENQCNWKKMDSARKDDIVNDHFVPADVRMHYEHERASSSCSFSSGWSMDRESMCQSQQYPPSYRAGEGLVVENRPRHLSQPEDWEERSAQHNNKHLSRSQKDLVYANATVSKKIKLHVSTLVV